MKRLMQIGRFPQSLLVVCFVFFANSLSTTLRADCNGNGIPDPTDIELGTSDDCNSDTIPDECEQSLFQLSQIGLPTDLESLPTEIGTADIDGDGFLDFIFASSQGGGAGISVYFNEVDAPDAELGAVSGPIRTRMGPDLEGFEPADVDLDGDADLVGASSFGVEVRWNDDGRAFSDAEPIPFSPRPIDMALGDFNGDGAVDVVVAHNKSDEDPAQISILLNSQTPGADPVAPAPPFQAPHAVAGDGEAVAVATGDFDGDGDVDIVTADDVPRGVSIFLNEGCGEAACSFAPAIVIPVAGRFRDAEIIATAQLTSDNAADIVVASSGTVFILRNAGDGRSFEISSLGTRTRQLKLADVDSDNDVDIISTGLRSMSVLLNAGDGRFDSLLDVGSGEELRMLVPADFDNDSRIDVAVATRSGDLAVFSQLGGDVINFETLDVKLPFGALPHAGSLADFDGDGDLDVVTGNGHRNTLSALENIVDESPVRFTPKNLGPAGAAVHAMTHGDFDNDGDVDFVAGGFDSNMRLFSNEGDWKFKQVQHISGRCVYLSAGDLNADGWLDLVCSGSVVSVYLNDGAGKLAESVRRQRAGAGVRNTVPADFNGDGFGDLAVANQTSQTVSILFHDGKGRFAGPQVQVGGSPVFVVAGDWNNDGHPDIATANVPQETFSVLLNQGDGSFGEPEIVVLRSRPFTMASGDLNGDGRLDIVTTNETAHTITVLLNLGDGLFTVMSHLEAGLGPRYTPVGDLDGDTIDDIVTLNRNGADARVFLNRFSATVASDFASTVCTLVDFAGLAARTRGASPMGDRLSVKYTVPARDDPMLIETVLQNTRLFPLHEQFLSTVHAESFPGLDAVGLIGLTQARATRDYYIGAVQRILTGQGFVFIFSIVTGAGPNEVLTVDEVHRVYKKLSGALTLRPLYYAPDAAGENPLARKASESWEDPPFPIFDGTVDLDVEYIAYTRSVGYGRVRLFAGDEFDEANDSGRFTFQDVVVIDHAPRDIEGVVGGVITAAPQGALSHISVRTARRRTPNAFVDKAMLLLKPFEGRLVRLEVKDDEYLVSEATQEEAEAFWDAREGLPEPRPFDREHRSLDRFEDIDFAGGVAPEARYGGKASGLARLQTILTGEYEQYRERGFAIPMAYYLDFMSDNVIPSEVDGRALSYQQYLDELFALEQFRTDSEYRFNILDDFRAFARDNGTLPEGLVDAITARIEEVFGSREVMVRHRSSSNVEDILQFNGAGLYESTGVCVADSFDDDDVGPSLCDRDREPERTIERALRKVWTSLWTFRAHEERSFFKIPQASATMGILVNRSFLKEKANGVAFTGAPSAPRGGCYLVTAQVGEESVVSPEPGILPEVNVLEVADGVVVNIVRNRRSTLVGEGEVILSDEKLKELGRLMWHIDENYPVDTDSYEREDILLDMEFKLESDDSLAVKQIRPFLIAGNRPARPTFELVIPPGAQACGVMNVVAPGGDLMSEYESKSMVRFRPGTHALPSSRCVFFGELFEEVIVGPAQEVATPDGPGLFRVSDRRETNGPGTVFRFKYEQTFSLPGDRGFKIELFNVEFTVRDGAPTESAIVLDDDYRTFQLTMLGTSEDPPLNVTYSSCGYSLLPEWNVAFDLDDGTTVRLAERFVQPDDVTRTGPAAVASADITIGGDSRRVTSYWDLVYAAGRHNTAVKYWVLLDPPASVEGVEGDVHVMALWGRDRPDVVDIVAEPQEEAAAYLDENFEELARPGLLSFERQEIVFLRGDSNLDGTVNISDAIRTVDALFREGTPLGCRKAADANDDGRLSVTDATWILLNVFSGRGLPEPSEVCGVDPTPDGAGCEELAACR